MNSMGFWIGGALRVSICAAGAVNVGDSVEQVRAELGLPAGELALGDRTVMCFSRGRVEVRDGRVIRADLVSAQEAQRLKAAEAEARAATARACRQMRDAQKAEGMALLSRWMNDPNFIMADPGDQAGWLRQFMVQYPDVPAGELLAEAIRRGEENDARDHARRAADAAVRAERAAGQAAAQRPISVRYGYATPSSWPYYDPWWGGYPAFRPGGWPHSPRPKPAPSDLVRPAPIPDKKPTSSFQAWPYDFGTGRMDSGR